MMYMRLSKALYEMLRASLLFYKRPDICLEDKRFAINDYDLCVANKMADGSKMTVCWHVDDLKISHRDDEMISAFTIEMAE